MIKERVLYLCGQAPWLQNGGSMLRNYWMIDALAKRYTVDLVVASEPGPMPDAFAGIVDHYACVPRGAAETGALRRALTALRRGESLYTAGWVSDALREHVAERLGRFPYAAIQVDLPMIGALPRRDGIPIVYNAHNCEAALLRRRARTEPVPMSAALLLDAAAVERQERALVRRAALVAACAQSDVEDFARFAPAVRRKAAIVPNGVDVARFASLRGAPRETKTVLVTGSMDWRPNVLGLRWFLQRVLPRLREVEPDAIVRVAGRMRERLAAELRAYPNVEAVPNPPSMEPLLGAATVVAAPILASSGTRLRILEAWAAGCAVVTTTAGAFGLDLERDRDLLVRDEARAFADAIALLLRSADLRANVAAAGARRACDYDWQHIGNDLLRAYEQTIPSGVRRVPIVKGESPAPAHV